MGNAFLLGNAFLRAITLGALAVMGLGAAGAEAGATKLNTADFTTSCVEDPIVADDPGFADGKVTPQKYCECVADKLDENRLSQADVDMLTKMHNEEITDADATNYATLEDLLVANEGFEDECKASLGIATGGGTDMEEMPEGPDMVPDEGAPPEDEGAPAQDDGSPPE
jgi:hypothetical protein